MQRYGLVKNCSQRKEVCMTAHEEVRPYRCGCFISQTGEQCILDSDHAEDHKFASEQAVTAHESTQGMELLPRKPLRLRRGAHNRDELLTGLEPNTGHYAAHIFNDQDGDEIVRIVNAYADAIECGIDLAAHARSLEEANKRIAELERDGWMPFSTAPECEEWILVFRPDAGVFMASYRPSFDPDNTDETQRECNGPECWFDNHHEDLAGDLPTHWQPLPPPPGAELTQEPELHKEEQS